MFPPALLVAVTVWVAHNLCQQKEEANVFDY
jgi:hypothetical protein